LPPALLSRFDLIYIMLDVPNEANDKRLASHILDLYSNKESHRIKYLFCYLVLELIGKKYLLNISAMPGNMSILFSAKMQVEESTKLTST